MRTLDYKKCSRAPMFSYSYTLIRLINKKTIKPKLDGFLFFRLYSKINWLFSCFIFRHLKILD